jgi:hypothetical protein
MSNLKDYIQPDKGFFWAMSQSNKDKYERIFGTYDNNLDMYFYFLYGFRPSSNCLALNTLENVGNILFIRYYGKWLELYENLTALKSVDTTKTETNDITVTYESNGTNSSTTNDVNKVYGFDSDDGKNDTTSDTTNNGTNTTTYTQTTAQDKTNTTNELNNIKERVKVLTDYDFLNTVINDILTTVSQMIYNGVED